MLRKKAPNPDKPLTDAEMNSGTWLHGINGLPAEAQVAIRKIMGRPRKEKTKKVISFRFDSDIISHLKNSVTGYNARVENVLREAIAAGKL
jgi:uncharacterized protein (DUF4415 family)